MISPLRPFSCQLVFLLLSFCDGLTICRLLAGVMGGEITVKSKVGVGSGFCLRLFLPGVAGRPQLARHPLVADAFGAGKTILVADDDVAHRSMIAEAMAPYGFDLRSAENGVEALDIARAINPDLCLLDIEMPGLNGWQLAETLRESGFRNPKIIILSASAMEEHRRSLATTFHDAFLMKPIDIDLLVETIANLLGVGARSREREVRTSAARQPVLVVPGEDVLHELLQDAEIGYVRGLRDRLSMVGAEPSLKPFADQMLALVENLDMPGVIVALKRLRSSAG